MGKVCGDGEAMTPDTRAEMEAEAGRLATLMEAEIRHADLWCADKGCYVCGAFREQEILAALIRARREGSAAEREYCAQYVESINPPGVASGPGLLPSVLGAIADGIRSLPDDWSESTR